MDDLIWAIYSALEPKCTSRAQTVMLAPAFVSGHKQLLFVQISEMGKATSTVRNLLDA